MNALNVADTRHQIGYEVILIIETIDPLFLNGQTPLAINRKVQHSKLQKLHVNTMNE